jgi:hypothetical protein
MRRSVVVPLAILVAMAALPARAEFPEGVPDKIRFGMGTMFANINTSGAVGKVDGIVGTYVNLEDVFNLPVRQSTVAGSAEWRVKGKHFLDFVFTQINREAGRVITENVVYGNYVFQANANVSATWKSSFPYVAYRYNFLEEKKVHIGGSVGISYLKMDAGLKANAGVTDLEGNPVEGTISESAGIEFPVPLIGMQVDWAFARRWTLRMFFRTLFINTQDFRGSHNMTGMNVDFFPTKHFGMGMGYNAIKVNLGKFTSDDLTGNFTYDIQGISLFFKGTF